MISPAGLLILTLTLDKSLHDRLKEKTSQRANDGNFMLFLQNVTLAMTMTTPSKTA